MTNEELRRHLRECLRTEESAVRIYYKHLRSAILRSGLPENTQQRIRSILDRLGRETEQHRATVDDILNKLEGEYENDREG